MYIELHSRSAFSFLEGASHPEALIDACEQLGMPSIALLDRDGMYGAARFHLWGKKLGVKAHIGAEVTAWDYTTRTEARIIRKNDAEPIIPGTVRIPLLAESRAGYQNLCRLITQAKLRAAKECSVATEEELTHFSSGLVCLTGDERGPLAEALMRGSKRGGPSEAMAEGRRCLERLARRFRAGQLH